MSIIVYQQCLLTFSIIILIVNAFIKRLDLFLLFDVYYIHVYAGCCLFPILSRSR